MKFHPLKVVKLSRTGTFAIKTKAFFVSGCKHVCFSLKDAHFNMEGPRGLREVVILATAFFHTVTMASFFSPQRWHWSYTQANNMDVACTLMSC